MAASRVISVRFTEVEYEALAGLALLEDTTINALIRLAAGEYVRKAVESPDYEEKKARVIRRAQEADRALRQAVGIDDTGAIPVISRDPASDPVAG